jgi:hypothetical protein
MVIVAGHITVEPQQRESYLAGCVRIAAAALTRNSAPAMLTVSVQEYDIADARPVFGKGRYESAGRTLLRPMRSAPRSGRIERRQNPARRALRP